jgi:hypothetical protein
MYVEVKYPLPKCCIICRKNFYVGTKIQKTCVVGEKFYNIDEKKMIIMYLNKILSMDITLYIIELMKKNIIYNFGHVSCNNRKNENIVWIISGEKDIAVLVNKI